MHADQDIAFKFFQRLVQYKLHLPSVQAKFIKQFPGIEPPATVDDDNSKTPAKENSKTQKKKKTSSEPAAKRQKKSKSDKAPKSSKITKSKSLKSTKKPATPAVVVINQVDAPTGKKRSNSGLYSDTLKAAATSKSTKATPEPKKRKPVALEISEESDEEEEVAEAPVSPSKRDLAIKKLGRGAFPVSKLKLPIQQTPSNPTEKPANRLVFSDRKTSPVELSNCDVAWCLKLVQVIFEGLVAEPHRKIADAVEGCFITLASQISKLEDLCNKNEWIKSEVGIFGLAWWVKQLGKLCRVISDVSYQLPQFITSIGNIKFSLGALREESKTGTVTTIGTKKINTNLGVLKIIVSTIIKDAHKPLLEYLFQLE